jgi:hypothetical protein
MASAQEPFAEARAWAAVAQFELAFVAAVATARIAQAALAQPPEGECKQMLAMQVAAAERAARMYSR